MAEHRPLLVAGPEPLSRRTSLAAWAGFLALAAFYVLYVTPRRGALFSDEAWYLYNAVQALSHGEIGTYLPQAPAHLFNAFFMLFLGDGYLPQRHAYTLCTLAAGWCLLAGTGGAAFARTVPLGLACVLVAGLSSVVNYQNGPGLFLALGLGLTFLGGGGGRGRPGTALLVSAGGGFFLAASAMANLTVAPGLVLICLTLLWGAWKARRPLRAVAPLACGVFLAAMLGVYVAALGLDRLFHVPEGHGFLFGRLGEIAAAAVAWPALWGALAGAAGLARRRGLPVPADPLAQSLWLLVAAAAVFLAKAVIVAAGGRAAYPLSLLPTQNAVILLPHYAYGLLSLALVRGWPGRREAGPAYGRGLFAALALLLYWAQQTFYSEIFVIFSMVFASGFLMALGLGLLSLPVPSGGERGGTRRAPGGALALAALVFVAGFLGYLETGGWTGETRLSGEKVEPEAPRLRGILESPQRAATLAAVKRAYDEAGCRDKALLCFNNASLLHYVLDHPAPPGLSYIPQPIYFEREIREFVASGAPWCVLYSDSYRRPGTDAQEKEFMAWLASRAATRREIGDPASGRPYGNFMLFTGPGDGAGEEARTPGSTRQ
jgi:hypothetical protein